MTYDCFSFFNELDLLEIRFNILDKYVDYFILQESTQTFSGLEKPLYYEENKKRFEKWNHKVIHCVTDKIENVDSFQRAHYQKENLMSCLNNANENDIIYFGDLDEIWTPQIINDDRVYKLIQLNYAYYLNNRSSELWIGTIVGKYSSIKNGGFNYHRANPKFFIENGGWHFTNMGGVEQIKKKLKSYDHQEYNNEHTLNLVEERMNSNQDFVGRSSDWRGTPFSFHIDGSELPKYILDNIEQYKHLMKI